MKTKQERSKKKGRKGEVKNDGRWNDGGKMKWKSEGEKWKQQRLETKQMNDGKGQMKKCKREGIKPRSGRCGNGNTK